MRIHSAYFSARRLADGQVEFYCTPCDKWHTHSWDKANVAATHRVAHCHSGEGGVFTDSGYFIKAVGSYDDDAWTRKTTKIANKNEYDSWIRRQREQAERRREIESIQERIKSMPQTRRKVKLFKSGDSMGVQTTATTPEEFLGEFAETIAELIEADAYHGDWEFQLRFWLPQAFEINAKLKGYKADVQEERVLYAGAPFVDDSMAVSVDKERDSLAHAKLAAAEFDANPFAETTK